MAALSRNPHTVSHPAPKSLITVLSNDSSEPKGTTSPRLFCYFLLPGEDIGEMGCLRCLYSGNDQSETLM